jgi:hypothetical protein
MQKLIYSKIFQKKKIYLLNIGFASVIIFLSQTIKMFGFFWEERFKKNITIINVWSA